MECVDGTSKPNLLPNNHTSSFSDDFWAVNGVSGENFFIDDLLNIPTDDNFVEEDNNSNKTSSVSPVKAVKEDKTIIPETELCFPVNDVDDLEWVSQFVDDSFSCEYSLTFPAQKLPETATETVTLVAVNPSFKNLVQKKPRSKRSRTSGGVWLLRSSSPVTDSSASSSSTSSCASKPLLCVEEILGKPTVNMQKRKLPAAMVSGQPQLRRCSHCLVQKTPQWRAGPLGPKTLCNACGVRFKSGRLLPEYRPACSPTFSGDVHSNNHRKVLEMRRKKAEAASGGLTLPVHGS
ncbi:hypothetical protein E3N88_02334 [Mikania micrantha]|uniref:GATA transcription factor n=1 Tax=Mikania micrantha TaxID=192012 RepID=A0A5N6Q5Q7_9ASTR|nr:hypothetical protein E3N88_02334 [Mikania micrantha]